LFVLFVYFFVHWGALAVYITCTVQPALNNEWVR
jgi:hypothetical protein